MNCFQHELKFRTVLGEIPQLKNNGDLRIAKEKVKEIRKGEGVGSMKIPKQTNKKNQNSNACGYLFACSQQRCNFRRREMRCVASRRSSSALLSFPRNFLALLKTLYDLEGLHFTLSTKLLGQNEKKKKLKIEFQNYSATIQSLSIIILFFLSPM